MTDKQRAGHAHEKYWNGFITRVEAQKVFDEQLQVIQMQAQAFAKFDVTISCLAEKLGITPADVNAWIAKKVEEAREHQNATTPEGSANTEQEVSRIIAP